MQTRAPEVIRDTLTKIARRPSRNLLRTGVCEHTMYSSVPKWRESLNMSTYTKGLNHSQGGQLLSLRFKLANESIETSYFEWDPGICQLAPRVTMRAQMSVKLHEGISSCEPKVIKDTQTTNFQTDATKELVKLLYYTTLYILTNSCDSFISFSF